MAKRGKKPTARGTRGRGKRRRERRRSLVEPSADPTAPLAAPEPQTLESQTSDATPHVTRETPAFWRAQLERSRQFDVTVRAALQRLAAPLIGEPRAAEGAGACPEAPSTGGWVDHVSLDELVDLSLRSPMEPVGPFVQPPQVTEAVWHDRVAAVQDAYGSTINLTALAMRASRELAYRAFLRHRLPTIAGRLRARLARGRRAPAAVITRPVRAGSGHSLRDLLEYTRPGLGSEPVGPADEVRAIIVDVATKFDEWDARLAALERLPLRNPRWRRRAPEPLGIAAYEVALYLAQHHPRHAMMETHVVTVLAGSGWGEELFGIIYATSPEERVRKAIDREAQRRTGRRFTI
jgi:hypothetical protein